MNGVLGRDQIPARKLRKDDVLFNDGKPRIVRKVVVNPPGCKHHTHVNDDWCYDNEQTVEIASET